MEFDTILAKLRPLTAELAPTFERKSSALFISGGGTGVPGQGLWGGDEASNPSPLNLWIFLLFAHKSAVRALLLLIKS